MRESLVKNPKYAYWYSRDVIRGRWTEAEPYLIKDKFSWDIYKERFNVI